MAHGIDFVKGTDLGNDLAKVMGLGDRPVVSIGIDCSARGAVIARVEFLVERDQAHEIAGILKEYRLVPIHNDAKPDGHYETLPEGVTPIVLPPREDGHFA